MESVGLLVVVDNLGLFFVPIASAKTDNVHDWQLSENNTVLDYI